MSRARTPLPAVQFTAGVSLKRWLPSAHNSAWRERLAWHVIGRLATGEPFFLNYYEGGLTSWDSPAHLGPALRQKILAALREQVRFATHAPTWLTVHDLTGVDQVNLDEGQAQALALVTAFRTEQWERDTLHLGPWVTLAVPFAEKDQAKALGASWDAASKSWRVRRQADMQPFAAWLPTVTAPLDHP